MPSLGPTELIIILVVVLLLFGAKKLPDLARSIGKSTSEFKKGLKEAADDDEEEAKKTSAEAKSDSASTS